MSFTNRGRLSPKRKYSAQHIDVSEEPTEQMLDKIDSDLLLNIDFMEMMELRHIPEEGCESFLDKINGAALPAIIRDSPSITTMMQWRDVVEDATEQILNVINLAELSNIDCPNFTAVIQLPDIPEEASEQILNVK